MKRITLAVIVLLSLTLASGCVDATYHLTINRNGSGDINIEIAINDLVLDLVGEEDPLVSLTKDLKLQGYTVSSFRDQGKTGLIARKHVERISAQSLDLVRIPGIPRAAATSYSDGFQIQQGFFKTRYKVQVDVDPADFTGTGQLGALESHILSQVNFQFVLTLPIQPDDHNAISVDDKGRTMIWTLMPGQGNRVLVEASHWNPVQLAITAIAILSFAGLLVLLRRQRKK